MSMRNAMMAGIYANPNYDDTKEQKGIRQGIVREVNDHFTEAIKEIRDPTPDIDLSAHPFFAAMKVPELDTHTEAMMRAEREFQEKMAQEPPEVDQR